MSIEKALKTAPDLPMALAMLAHSFINLIPLVPVMRYSSEILESVPNEPQMPNIPSVIAIGYIMLGEDDSAHENSREAHERMPNASWHSLVYAAAAASNEELLQTSSFREMLSKIDLPFTHFRDLLYCREEDVQLLEKRLTIAGLQK